MREIKGYVVRGKDRATGEACHHAPPLADRVGADGTLGYAPDQIDAAAWGAACLRRDSDDVRILAVDEDGIETPLPTYAAALDEVGQLCAEVNLARGRTMAALAETERLRGEVDTMRGQRDAFRGHLDLAYRNADAERAEAERLRALLAKVFGGEAAEAGLGQLVELAAEELAAVGASLAEAGVEARGPDDTLPARVGRLIEDADDARAGDAISEEQTSALWHAVDAATDGMGLDEHLSALGLHGIDAGPVMAVRDMRAVLAGIVAAWRDDEIGAIDGALIEDAEALLGITPEADTFATEPAS